MSAPTHAFHVSVNGGPPTEVTARPTNHIPSSGYTSGDYIATVDAATVKFSACGAYSATIDGASVHNVSEPRWGTDESAVLDLTADGGPHLRIFAAGPTTGDLEEEGPPAEVSALILGIVEQNARLAADTSNALIESYRNERDRLAATLSAIQNEFCRLMYKSDYAPSIRAMERALHPTKETIEEYLEHWGEE